jgi:hypothetical protein
MFGVNTLVDLLQAVLTFQFLIPACVIAAALLAGAKYLSLQDYDEKKVVPVAASAGMSVSLGELATYDGTVGGKVGPCRHPPRTPRTPPSAAELLA